MSRVHPISAIVINESGVLARIAGMFARRGFNIDSLAVGETQDPKYSRMTILVRGDNRVLEQVVKQLGRMVDVIEVNDLAQSPHVERELALIKVHAPASGRGEIIELVDIFRAKIVDVAPRQLVIEISGNGDKVDAMIDMLKPYGIAEMARTGRIILARGSRASAAPVAAIDAAAA